MLLGFVRNILRVIFTAQNLNNEIQNTNIGDNMRIVFRSLLLIVIGILFVQCSGKNDQEYYESAMELIKENKFDEAINEFSLLIKDYPISHLVGDAYFEMGKIYHGKMIKSLSEIESLEQAVEYYGLVANKFPDSPNAPKSLFMVGFIQANELRQLDKAKQTYNKFIEKYPDNELAKSAQIELDNLGLSPEEILMKKLQAE